MLDILLVLAAAAKAPEAPKPTSQARTAEYSRTVAPGGDVHIRGVDPQSRRRFHFVVNKTGVVRGQVDNQPVSFHVLEVR